MAQRTGYRTVSPYLVCAEADEVVRLAVSAFGARPVDAEIRRDDGRLMHVALAIGDSVVMVGTPPDGRMRIAAMLHLYVDDCEAVHDAAVEAGASSEMLPALQPHGDRAAMVKDAGGNLWWIATPVEDVPAGEVARRLAPT